jgi:nucleoside-diphosphate-sugar epimerase
MQYARILITGASGFIGSRPCEKFTLQYGLPYRAAGHRFDRAARIARLGSELISLTSANPLRSMRPLRAVMPSFIWHSSVMEQRRRSWFGRPNAHM